MNTAQITWPGYPRGIEILDPILRTIGGSQYYGLNTYGDGRPGDMIYDEAMAQATLDALNATVSAFDPVFFDLDKVTIKSDGTDTATLYVDAPKVGAASVTITITQGASSQDVPITLDAGGLGALPITSNSQGIISLTLKNGTGRNTETLIIWAS